MIDPFAFVVIALAGWRLAYMITNEEGPGNVFGEIRKSVQGEDMVPEPGSLDKLIGCVYCMSFWMTAYVYLVWRAFDVQWIHEGITIIAAWGAATALDMVARRDG